MIGKGLISAIVPVYNGETYLEEALDSIIHQSHAPDELILIDDGSTDNTKSIAKKYIRKYDLKYYYQSNTGLPSSRNEGIAESNSEYIAFLDADDIWTKDKLRLQHEAFLSNPNLEMVSGKVIQFLSPELGTNEENSIKFTAEPMHFKSPSVSLIKRNLFQSVGLYNRKWKIGADMDWYMRSVEMGVSHEQIPEVVLRRRIHSKNEGILKGKHFNQRFHILKEALDRRRKLSKSRHTKS